MLEEKNDLSQFFLKLGTEEKSLEMVSFLRKCDYIAQI